MATVSETELKNKISELVTFIRDYHANNEKNIKISDRKDGYQFSIIDKDVFLDFYI